ncbi:MAG TPA: glycosyltransferase family 4 protein, partial [Bacteroidota bacterium]
LETARRLRCAQRRVRYDIVQLNSTFDLKALLRDLTVVLSLRRDGRKIVLKFHGSEAKLIQTENPLLRLLMMTLFACVDAVGVLSTEERQNLIEAGVDPAKVFVVKNILNPSLYQSDPGFHSRWGLDPEVPVLLYAARFIPGKGVLDAVRTCGLLAQRGERFVLICAGDGPEREAAQAEARRLGVQARVRFTGYVAEEQMRELYANATLLLFPTFYDEGFPMVVFQSVAAGLPVVTTRLRGSADYLREYDNCLWTEPHNPSLSADRVQVLLRHPDLRASMASANRKLALGFVADKVAAEYDALYRHLLFATHDGEGLEDDNRERDLVSGKRLEPAS